MTRARSFIATNHPPYNTEISDLADDTDVISLLVSDDSPIYSVGYLLHAPTLCSGMLVAFNCSNSQNVS